MAVRLLPSTEASEGHQPQSRCVILIGRLFVVAAPLPCPLEHHKQRRSYVKYSDTYINDVTNHKTYVARSSETFCRPVCGWQQLVGVSLCLFKATAPVHRRDGPSSSVHGRWEHSATGGERNAILIRGRRFLRVAKVLKKFWKKSGRFPRTKALY